VGCVAATKPARPKPAPGGRAALLPPDCSSFSNRTGCLRLPKPVARTGSEPLGSSEAAIQFRSSELPGGSTYTYSIAAADVDGDGDLDVLVWNANDLNFNFPGRVLLNAGDGTFPTSIELPGGSASTYSIAAADVDGDGDLDFLLGNHGSPSRVLLNAGDGTFPTSIELPGGSAPTYSIAAADVDGDGDLDVLLGNNGSPSRVLLNTGDGTFPTSIALPGGSAFTRSIAAADVDGDGDLDVLLGNDGSPSRVLLNAGDGTFPTSIALPGGSASTYSIAAADVDGDGDLDVLLGIYDSPSRVLLNAGGGTFPTSIALPGGSASTWSIAAADVDGDGDLDVLLGNDGSPSRVLLNAGDGTFPTSIALPGGSASTNSIAAADVDGDGDLDVLLGNAGSPSRVLLNAGDGTFLTSIELPGGSASTYSIAAADVDGDGDLDVLLGIYDSPSRVLLNAGDGTFPTSIELPGGSASTNSIAAADVDGDGDLDVLLGNWGSPSRVLPFIRCSQPGTARSRYGNGCVRCPTPSTRRDDDFDVCYECDEHTQLDASGECVACTEGSERFLGATRCTRCPAGKRHAATGTGCIPCSPGEYVNFLGLFDPSTCLPCLPGSYNPTSGASACTPCPPATYSSDLRSVECSACPRGGFCPLAGAAALSLTFSPCPAGTYNPDEGSSTNTSCRSCPAGTANPVPQSTAASACRACLPGSHAAQHGTPVCDLCPTGKFTSTSGSTACQPCTQGYLCVEGSSAPQPCPGGTHANQTVLTLTGYLGSLSECVVCPVGTSCSVGSAVAVPCAPGTYNNQPRQETCLKCAAGSFQELAGQTSCNPCTPGYYCAEGAATPVPCPRGKYNNRTGLEFAVGCEPVGFGFWAPTGSDFPIPCPSGFSCPGFFNDNVTFGSQPLILPSGGLTPVVVVETQTVETATGSISLNEPLSSFLNDTALQLQYRQTIAAQLGIPWQDLQLDFSAAPPSVGRRLQTSFTIVTYTIIRTVTTNPTTSIATSNASGPPVVAPSFALNNLDPAVLGAALGVSVAALVAPTATVVQQTVTVIRERVCPRGFWCTAGLEVACEQGFYNPNTNAASQTACLRCPEFSTTNGTAATNVSECVCQASFVRQMDAAGSPQCVCAAGRELIGGVQCAPCKIGTYKDWTGKNLFRNPLGPQKCLDCPVPKTTTEQEGANSISQCVCEVGTFASLTRAEMMQATNDSSRVAADAFECRSCVSIQANAYAEMTNCTAPGVTLDTIPVVQGHWRQNPRAQYVRMCDLKEACLGGEIAGDTSCADGHTGPMCDLCVQDPPYFGGRGKPCQLCSDAGDPETTIIAYAIGGAVILIAIVAAMAVCKRRATTIAKGALGSVTGKPAEVGDEDEVEGATAPPPQELTDPHSTAEAQAIVGRRVLVQGMQQRKDLNGGHAKVIQWNAEASRWDIEMEMTGNEKILVCSPNLSIVTDKTPTKLTKLEAAGARVASIVGSVGVKLRILISLCQVVSQLGVIFNVQYPPFYTSLLASIENINIPIDSLPFGCMAPQLNNFLFDLVLKTATPIILVVLLLFLRRVLRTFSGGSGFGAFLADACSDLWFFIIFLVFPSCSNMTFMFFMRETYDGPGEVFVDLMRADRSINRQEPLYHAFSAYAVVMLGVYPIGVPLLYALMFHRARHQLHEMRRIELTQETDFKLAKLEAEAEATPEKVDEMVRRAIKAREASMKALESLRGELPTTLRKLTAGYELRTYWFEIFECVRKILLIGLPIFFPPGSPPQLIFGLMICFLSYGAYCVYSPYVADDDDLIAQVAQVIIFFSLISSLVTDAYPEDSLMSALLPALLAVPVVLTFIFETQLWEYLRSYTKPNAEGNVGLAGRWFLDFRRHAVRITDRCE
jgi:hypothetical protein